MLIRVFHLIFFLFLLTDSFSLALEKEEKNVVINHCTQTFTYKLKNKKVVVEEIKEVSYLCTQFQSAVFVSELYDNDLIINKLKINSKGGYSKPVHRPYFEEKIANTDRKICYFELNFKKKGESAWVKWEKTHTDIHYFNTVHFTDQFYTQNKTIRLIVPRWMTMEIIPLNFDENVSETVTYDAGSDSDIYTYSVKEADAWNKDTHAPGASYIYPHLLILNQSCDYKGFHEDFFHSLQDLYRWNKYFVSSLENDENFIRQFAQNLTQDASSEIEKIRIIYEWVQDNIRYLADNSGVAGFKPEAAHDVLRKKYGDCKGMANLLKCLLSTLGLDARLAWIGTNNIAYDFSLPTIANINHMICALFLQDTVYYLDATVKYLAFKDYSETIQGKKVMIEDGDNYFLYTVPVKGPEQNPEMEKSTLTIENQSLTGNVSVSFRGESKNSFLHAIHATEKNKLKDALTGYFSENNSQYILSDLKMSSLQSKEEEINFSYALKNSSGIHIYDDKIFINPDFRQELNHSDIDTTEIKVDFWLPYKYNIIQECEINIPAGLEIESFPDTFLLERETYTFHIRYFQSDDKLYYNKRLIIRDPKIRKETFSQWNTDIERLKACYREQVVLKRKNR
jgi:hypothetical protein